MKPIANIELTVYIRKDRKGYIAHAMPLNVMGSGNSPEEAKKTLDEVLYSFWVAAEEMGTLIDILHLAGYEFVDGQWICPRWVSIEKRCMAIGA